MTIPARPIGQDPQSQWLWYILQKLDRLTQIISSAEVGTAVTIANGADVALGSTTDAKSSATDATATTIVSLIKEISYLLQNKIGTTIADGDQATIGAKTDARSIATDTTAITAMQVWKQISYMLQNPATIPNGGNVALGSTTDAKSASTDTTAVTAISLLKELSYLLQSVESVANTARTVSTVVIPTQPIDESGNVLGKTAANTTRTVATLVTPSQIVDATGNVIGISAANTARAASDKVLLVQTIDATGSIGAGATDIDTSAFAATTSKGQVIMAIGNPSTLVAADQKGAVGMTLNRDLRVFNPPSTMMAEYRSPTDFTAVFASSTTLTVTGAPFTVDDSVCRVTSILYKDVNGVFRGLFNARGGVSITCVSGTITVAGAGTPFTNTDTIYDVNLTGPKKAYDNTLDVLKSIDQAPLSSQYVLDSLIDTTNVTAATNYYPSSTGMAMDGFRDMSLTGQLIDSDNTTTMTLEVTNDEDAVNANWQQIYGYDSIGNANINSVICASTTKNFAWNFDNFNFSLFRVKIVNGDNTNTMVVKCRRKAL